MTAQTIHVDPEECGWRRHPTIPRCWITDKGQLFEFPPNMPEKLVVRRL